MKKLTVLTVLVPFSQFGREYQQHDEVLDEEMEKWPAETLGNRIKNGFVGFKQVDAPEEEVVSSGPTGDPGEPPAIVLPDDLDDLTKAQLREYGATIGLTLSEELKKDELLVEIRAKAAE